MQIKLNASIHANVNVLFYILITSGFIISVSHLSFMYPIHLRFLIERLIYYYQNSFMYTLNMVDINLWLYKKFTM